MSRELTDAEREMVYAQALATAKYEFDRLLVDFRKMNDRLVGLRLIIRGTCKVLCLPPDDRVTLPLLEPPLDNHFRPQRKV